MAVGPSGGQPEDVALPSKEVPSGDAKLLRRSSNSKDVPSEDANLLRPLTFTDVTEEDVERLQTMVSRDEIVATLSKCMRLPKDGGFQTEILAEFHYHNFAFCQRARLSPAKTSTLLSIMTMVHTRAVVEQELSEASARVLFEQLLQLHLWQLPPHRVGVLTPDEADLMRAFAERNFFQLFKMYKFVYISREDITVRTVDRGYLPQVASSSSSTSAVRVARGAGDAIGEIHTAPSNAISEHALAFRAEDEVDPRDVPELQHLFSNATSSAGGHGTAGAADGHESGEGVGIDASASRRPSLLAEHGAGNGDDGDDVAAAIDEVFNKHWGSLDERFKLPA